MIVFNLTDQAKAGKPSPHDIRISGRVIKPGAKAEFDNLNIAKMSGMILSGKIAINMPPEWYVEARRYKRRKLREVKLEAPKGRVAVLGQTTKRRTKKPKKTDDSEE
jgi:hypothetical protein